MQQLTYASRCIKGTKQTKYCEAWWLAYVNINEVSAFNFSSIEFMQC